MCGEMLNVLLVGYMNVGKFILFNVLIYVGVYVVDQFFVMLDIILCKLWIDGVGNIVILDIVGFICDLFYLLVDVFYVMLEVVIDVDVLLYVVDSVSYVCDE